ncbi:MAG: hypothetical protein BWY79_01834 [Actinobacteria bacterium ADurb.Bin444]|nr:MAG: hypothetical protein BWY79_01834 [Actinobacteria bacterium ADurb.Bin444]
MSALLTVRQVLAAQSQLPQLSLEVANDLFRSTWLASHVRLVELMADTGVDLPLFLAYALTRNPADDFRVEEWLPNTEFRAVAPDDLDRLIAQALSDMHEEETRSNDVLADALVRLSTHGAQSIHEIEAKPDYRRPYSPYEYGPTYQMFWIDAGRFYFLEVHHES